MNKDEKIIENYFVKSSASSRKDFEEGWASCLAWLNSKKEIEKAHRSKSFVIDSYMYESKKPSARCKMARYLHYYDDFCAVTNGVYLVCHKVTVAEGWKGKTFDMNLMSADIRYPNVKRVESYRYDTPITLLLDDVKAVTAQCKSRSMDRMEDIKVLIKRGDLEVMLNMATAKMLRKFMETYPDCKITRHDADRDGSVFGKVLAPNGDRFYFAEMVECTPNIKCEDGIVTAVTE